jgi:hypothetical protein
MSKVSLAEILTYSLTSVRVVTWVKYPFVEIMTCSLTSARVVTWVKYPLLRY